MASAFSLRDFTLAASGSTLTKHITRFKGVVDGKRACHCHVCGLQFDSPANLRNDDVQCPKCAPAAPAEGLH